MRKRIIIASNRLPVGITEQAGKVQIQRSNGGLATALTSVLHDYESIWLGWAGTTLPQKRWRLKLFQADRHLRPVTVPADLLHGYYDQFSNGVLWPSLHGMSATITPTAADWEAYRAVNLRFARDIKRTASAADTIWIHDYHLMLVPQMLREMGITNRIGFFLHTPFATPEALRAIPMHPELLRSLAQVDLMGLQTERDARHFQAALKAAGVSLRPGSTVRDFPIGVDYKAYGSATKQLKVKAEMTKVVTAVQNKQVILSVSRLDYTKGIPEQLQAYEQLLASHPQPEKLLYKLIVAPSREDAAGYRELKLKIEALVQQINSRFGTESYQPIDYTYRNCSFEEVTAWYLLADVLLVTPYIDGMNLVVKEFIATRSDDQSMIVLSETIGAAQQLTGALQVNPHRVADITDRLQQALSMPPEERAPRWRSLRHTVRTENIFWWVNEFLAGLRPGRTPAVLFSDMLHTPRTTLSARLHPRRLLQFAQLEGQRSSIYKRKVA